jgi:hypothetical protein
MTTAPTDARNPADLPPLLSTAAIRLYGYVVGHSSVELSEIDDLYVGASGLLADAKEELLAFGLLRWNGKTRLTAVDPTAVLPDWFRGEEDRLLENQRRLSLLRGQMLTLNSLHKQLEAGHSRPVLERLSTLAEARGAVIQLTAECTEEVLAVQPGGPWPEKTLSEASERDLDMLTRGVALRTLYQHSVRFDPTTMRYAADLRDKGAEIRTVAHGLTRFLVFDRKTTVVPLTDPPGGVLVIRDPDVGAIASALFGLLWTKGEPIETGHSKPFVQVLSDQTKLAILRLLVQGADDRAVARALSISVRTCQRHVSEIMHRVGAQSRLHLGYLICQHRLLSD